MNKLFYRLRSLYRCLRSLTQMFFNDIPIFICSFISLIFQIFIQIQLFFEIIVSNCFIQRLEIYILIRQCAGMFWHLRLQNFAIDTFHHSICNSRNTHIRMRRQRLPLQQLFTPLIGICLRHPQPQLSPQIGNARPRPNDRLLMLLHASPRLLRSFSINITGLWPLLLLAGRLQQVIVMATTFRISQFIQAGSALTGHFLLPRVHCVFYFLSGLS